MPEETLQEIQAYDRGYDRGYKQAVKDGDAQLQRVIERMENPTKPYEPCPNE